MQGRAGGPPLLRASMLPVDKPVKDPVMCFAALARSCSHMAYAGAEQGGAGRSCCSRLAEPKGSSALRRQRDEKPVMDLRRLCCAGLCACGAAFVVLVVPSLRFILASQAGLVAGWRAAAMPPNILTIGANGYWLVCIAAALLGHLLLGRCLCDCFGCWMASLCQAF